MLLFRLLTVAFITTFSSQRLSESCTGLHAQYQNAFSATIILGDRDMKVLSADKYQVEIAITNPEKLQMIIDSGNPVILLIIGKEHYVAKPQYTVSASFPAKCDLFYLVDANGKNSLSMDHNRISFQKIKTLTDRSGL